MGLSTRPENPVSPCYFWTTSGSPAARTSCQRGRCRSSLSPSSACCTLPSATRFLSAKTWKGEEVLCWGRMGASPGLDLAPSYAWASGTRCKMFPTAPRWSYNHLHGRLSVHEREGERLATGSCIQFWVQWGDFQEWSLYRGNTVTRLSKLGGGTSFWTREDGLK